MAASRFPLRRRSRSARVTGAVTLLSIATALVMVAVTTRTAVWIALASVVALGLAWAGLRLMWTEVLESRRTNAADRAAAAAAYRHLFAARAAEHAAFTTAMTERLAQATLAQRELEGQVVHHEDRAQRAEVRLATEAEARTTALERVRRLEELVSVLRADDDSVVDLAAWDEQAQKSVQRKHRALKQA